MDETGTPQGELILRKAAFPADANYDGDIFGGWLLALMDLSAGVAARAHTHGRVATVGADSIAFVRPVYVGDIVACHVAHLSTGRTSIVFGVEAWAQRGGLGPLVRVTSGRFTLVALDLAGEKRVIGDV